MAAKRRAKGSSRGKVQGGKRGIIRTSSADGVFKAKGQGSPLASEPLLLAGLPTWDDLLPSEAQRFSFETNREGYASGIAGDAEPVLGCVVRLDRGFPVVVSEQKTGRCEYGQGLSSLKTDSRAAVGDWVVAWWPEDHDMGVVDEILPRESDIARWRGSSRGEKQTLAANVDVVLIVQALSKRELLLDRIARSVVIARDCGARASVVLTKADRPESREVLADELRRVQELVGSEVNVVLSSVHASESEDLAQVAQEAGCGWGTAGVLSLVPKGTVAIVLGESGAGKSTLLNALLGNEILDTNEVRVSDDAGRHTTVTRRMVQLPGAGIIVDEPGLRSLPLVGHERGLALAFPAIAQAARACRFRDCTHGEEPGCEVRAAFTRGEFGSLELESYLALAAEMRSSATSLDPDVVL